MREEEPNSLIDIILLGDVTLICSAEAMAEVMSCGRLYEFLRDFLPGVLSRELAINLDDGDLLLRELGL